MSWGHKTVYTDTLWGLLFRVGDRWADIFNTWLNLALGAGVWVKCLIGKSFIQTCICVYELQKVMASFALALFPCCENEVTFDLLIYSKATLTCLLPIFHSFGPLIFFFLFLWLSGSLSVCLRVPHSLFPNEICSLWGKGSEPQIHTCTRTHQAVEGTHTYTCR